MIHLSRDIRSLSDFKRNTGQFMKQLRKTHQPVVLTVNGKAELIVQTADSYQEMMEKALYEQHLDFLRTSYQQAIDGKTTPIEEAFKQLGKKHKRKTK